MSRKTLALISGLVLVTLVLFVIALRSNQGTPKTNVVPTETAMEPSPTESVAHSVLSLSPNPVNVQAGGRGTVEVNIDTSDNAVTAAQLEIAYDPEVLSNVVVTPGPLFQNAVVLINKNDPATGRFTYAFGRTPGQTPVTGTGVVATISFTARAATSPSQLTLLPASLVTARGVANSVLKSSTGTEIIVGSGGAGVGLPPQTQTQTSTPPAAL